MLPPAVCMISLPYVNSNWSQSPETAKLGVDLCDLDLWPLTLTFCMDITLDHGNNSWKFHDDTMMGTWWKRCDRQTDGRTDGRTENTICRAAWSQLKTIGHLFYATSSFVHHFVAIGEFKLELQSGNAQFGSKSTIFLAVWPWNLTDDLEKQLGTSSKQHQTLCIISPSYVNSNWSYGPETLKLGVNPCDLDLWPLTLNFCMDLTLIIGNISWKFHDDTIMGTWSTRQI